MTVVAWPSLIGHLISVDVKAKLFIYSWHDGVPVWPSGKAGKQKALARFRFGSLPSLQKGCGLWTLYCEFVPHN